MNLDSTRLWPQPLSGSLLCDFLLYVCMCVRVCVCRGLVFQLGASDCVTLVCDWWDDPSLSPGLPALWRPGQGGRGAANGLWSLHTLPTAKQISSNEVSNVGAAGWHNPAWQLGPLAARKTALPPALYSALAWPLLPPRATPHGEVPTVNHAGQCASWHANVGHCICKCVITKLACQDTLARLCSQQAVVAAL